MIKQKPISARINLNLLDMLDKYCADKKQKRNYVINQAIEELLSKKLENN